MYKFVSEYKQRATLPRHQGEGRACFLSTQRERRANEDAAAKPLEYSA